MKNKNFVRKLMFSLRYSLVFIVVIYFLGRFMDLNYLKASLNRLVLSENLRWYFPEIPNRFLLDFVGLFLSFFAYSYLEKSVKSFWKGLFLIDFSTSLLIFFCFVVSIVSGLSSGVGNHLYNVLTFSLLASLVFSFKLFKDRGMNKKCFFIVFSCSLMLLAVLITGFFIGLGIHSGFVWLLITIPINYVILLLVKSLVIRSKQV